MQLLSLIEGLGFDPFFRGFLSVLVGVVVLMGGTYLLIATNSGSRTGGLIAGSALFGWMFLMGIAWTIYGIGWRGTAPTWELVEINGDSPATPDDGLIYAENPDAQRLGLALEGIDVAGAVTSDDPDEAQKEALAYARENESELEGWRYLVASDPVRGEAQSAAEEHLIDEHVFDTTSEYIALQFGAFGEGGKPLLDPDISVDDPDKRQSIEMFTDAPARILHKLDTMTLHIVHPEELLIIQVQGTVEQAALPGVAPPIASADPEKSVVNVIMRRDRGGPIPWLMGGLRFTPLMFTFATGIVFALMIWSLHNREKREMLIRAGK